MLSNNRIKQIVNESIKKILTEDNRTDQAKERCLQIIQRHTGINDVEILYERYNAFMKGFYSNPDYRKKPIMRLAPLFCNLLYGVGSISQLNRLKKIFNYIYALMENNKINVNEISLDLSYDEMDNIFGKQIDQIERDEEERMRKIKYGNSGEYIVIGPVDYETAKKYGSKSNPNNILCYVENYRTWCEYTDNDLNNVYIILKNGWENIPAEHDDESKSAYDTYGLSMIFVIVDENGGLAYCNTRWNHEASFKRGFSTDHAMDRIMISELIGKPFNSVFK